MKNKKLIKIVSLVVALSMVFSLTAFAMPERHKNYQDHKSEWSAVEKYVKDKEIFKGDGFGNYNWEGYVKRGDITLMIVRTFKFSMINKGNFDDVDKTEYYFDAIATAKAHGIAKGNGKSFNPKKYVTIEEAIALIERSASVANSNVVLAKLGEGEHLHDIYDKEDFNKPATREDVANMLYYILTGGEYKENDTEKEKDIIKYDVKYDEYETFDVDDFKDVSKVFLKDNHDDFEYVKFIIPSSSKGTLYYNYNDKNDTNDKVIARDRYYVSGNDVELIDDVSFVPNQKYSGTFYIKYTAYDDNDELYEGLIEITVEGQEKEVTLKTISYKIEDNDYDVATLVKESFKTVFELVSDEDFDYVKFEESNYEGKGSLYYEYDADDESNSRIDEDLNYFYNPTGNENGISKIAFVPDNDYVDTMYINYTAYGDVDDEFEGKIKITVSDKYDIKLITYTTKEDVDFYFNDSNFEIAFDGSIKNETLEFVQFERPNTDYGTLYNDGEKDTAADKIKVADIDDVEFELENNYNGTFLIHYTAFDDDGDTYSGLIKVIVAED